MRNGKGCWLSVALIAVGVNAQPTYAMTIEQAWQAAKKFDPSYQKSQLDEQISETTVLSAKGELFPSLSTGANATWSEHGKYSNSYDVTFEQTLWDSSKWANLDQSQATYLAAQLSVAQAYNVLAEKVITAYLELAQAQSNLDLAKQKRLESKKIYDITQKNYQAGKIRLSEVEETKANYIDAQSIVLASQSELQQKKSGLMLLTNESPTVVDEIAADGLVKPELAMNDQQRWVELAKNSSPELLVAKQKVTAAEFGREKAQAGYYPTLSGKLTYSDGSERRNDNLSAGLNVRLPLDLNGSTRAQVDKASLEILSAKQDVIQVEVRLKTQVEQDFQQLNLDWQRVEIAQQQILTQQTVLKAKELEFSAGLSQASDVIRAHNLLFDKKNKLRSQLYQYWKRRVSLLKTVGQLDDTVIKQLSMALHS
ncbi:TolC family protein [Vibrio tapetis]|uniref:Type I secretion outer membrane protein, TolC n=1 Tax=Vibrio tapetis subsp. tapetis TaxID=1671868 RepID=A0A2N8Z8Q5_9VIBR|nr:TolC family protein [Vibrio tapetis]SON48295.1 Type I secretion outer membrane protein, TolC [Vibrio tapetis subsp. tapetis]